MTTSIADFCAIRMRTIDPNHVIEKERRARDPFGPLSKCMNKGCDNTTFYYSDDLKTCPVCAKCKAEMAGIEAVAELVANARRVEQQPTPFSPPVPRDWLTKPARRG
ncbi:MAG: hypothetical protein ABR529_11695 [Actinomycetota bacterium]